MARDSGSIDATTAGARISLMATELAAGMADYGVNIHNENQNGASWTHVS